MWEGDVAWRGPPVQSVVTLFGLTVTVFGVFNSVMP